MPHNDDIVLRGRIVPSENDLNEVCKETIEKEDVVGIRAWKQQGAPGLRQARPMPNLPPSRAELLTFAQSVGQAGDRGSDWRRLLNDPQSAAAMRTVRRRVDELLSNARRQELGQQLIPDTGYRAINSGGHRPDAFVTSKLNPLEATELMKGWDPRSREWTGRRGLAGLAPEQTSFWCESWGGCSSDVAVDQDVSRASCPFFFAKRPAHMRDHIDTLTDCC